MTLKKDVYLSKAFTNMRPRSIIETLTDIPPFYAGILTTLFLYFIFGGYHHTTLVVNNTNCNDGTYAHTWCAIIALLVWTVIREYRYFQGNQDQDVSTPKKNIEKPVDTDPPTLSKGKEISLLQSFFGTALEYLNSAEFKVFLDACMQELKEIVSTYKKDEFQEKMSSNSSSPEFVLLQTFACTVLEQLKDAVTTYKKDDSQEKVNIVPVSPLPENPKPVETSVEISSNNISPRVTVTGSSNRGLFGHSHKNYNTEQQGDKPIAPSNNVKVNNTNSARTPSREKGVGFRNPSDIHSDECITSPLTMHQTKFAGKYATLEELEAARTAH